MNPGSALRAKILYQLFELLSDASDERLSLTRGDLRFYQDVATADPHPGMLGGILSLILSDSNPKKEFQIEEERAVKYFNRAAAYRIFTAYKQEYPIAPELAQMYLDVVRLYTATKETAVAAETLAEFENRYPDYLAGADSSSNSERKQSRNSTARPSSVDYATVISRYVASLDKENRTPEILALYRSEIKKYEAEQGLYEQMLEWLGQTNMVE